MSALQLLVLIDRLIDFLKEYDTYDAIEELFQSTKIRMRCIYKSHLSVIATTQRLIIRPVEYDDIGFYQNELWGSKAVMNSFGSGNVRLYWSKSERTKINYAKNRIDIWVKRWKEKNPFSGFTVVETKTKNKIGHVIVGGGELAFLFAQKWWGQGYATESVSVLINIIIPYLYTNSYSMDIDKIYASVRTDNVPSQRVMEKSGLKSDKKIHFKQFDDRLYERFTYSVPIDSLVQNFKRFRN